MYCNQCEQTVGGRACTVNGLCGKKADVAALQDHLVLTLRRLAETALAAGLERDLPLGDFVSRALFSTLTNVNFDPADLQQLIDESEERNWAIQVGKNLPSPRWTREGIDALADDPDICSAMQILLFGLKGMAAYLDHAAILGQRDAETFAFLHEALAAGGPGRERDLNAWLDLILACGKSNLRALELLDTANTSHFGDPSPHSVSLGQRKGKAILISGHDLADLEALLEQTAATGIQVYTHGEMLPAHAYPGLRKFPHLAGHFGTAWQNQGKEFPAFPGAILFTTNCIQEPGPCADKIFTTGNVGWPGLVHCPKRGGKRDFSALIAKALAMPGFSEDVKGKEVLIGFGRKSLLDAAPAVLEAIKSGAVKHIFLVGGCDGAKPGRNYYTEFVEKTPANSLVLTLACGKFRFFDKDLGTLAGLPRLLDVGQCNDAYAAVRTALALAEALGCGVNDLPLSLILSWYEQKAVCILLTLLALGVKNIRLGPSLPAFVSPNILDVLVKNWNIMPITSPDADLAAILGAKG